jgi:ABC-type oligopeptide transport system substrate-binding subunit
MGWSADYADPDSFLRTGLRRTRTGWHNDTFDLLVEQQAKQSTNQQERMKLYRQADRILIEEAAILPLTHRTIPWLVKPWISKFPVSPTKWWFPKDIIIEQRDAST